MNAFGVVLQVIGLVVAVGALIWELRATHEPHSVDLPDPMDGLARSRNPWGYTVTGQTISQTVKVRLGHEPRPASIRGAAEEIARQVDIDRHNAHDGWDAQVKALAGLARANQEILAAQLAQVAAANEHMRTRVLIEMTGLVVAIVGTVLSAL